MSARTRAWPVLLAIIVAACGSPTPSKLPSTPPNLASPADSAPPTTSTPSAQASASTPSSRPAVPVTPGVVPQQGTFKGLMRTEAATYPVTLWIDGCGHPDEVCGDIEYADPKHPEFVLCAPQLIFKGRDGDRDLFDENPAFGADSCSPKTLEIASTGSSPRLKLDIKGYTDSGAPPCCSGTLAQTSAKPPGPEAPPKLHPIEGLVGPLSAADLGGPTNQFSAAGATRAYFPVPGELPSVSLDTGRAAETIAIGDISDPSDPRSVTTIGDAIWVARGPTNTLERVDVTPDAAATAPIPLPHTPYALAPDGTTLWVTSLEDDVVMAVDTTTGQVVATVDVPKPAGVAVGGGSVWVVEHLAGRLARIDPATDQVADEVVLGQGNDPDCGMCAQQVIYAYGSAWTANELGRSITRVDGRTHRATTFPTYNRVWSVAAYRGFIYGAEYEAIDNHIDRSIGGIVVIGPQSGHVRQFPAPGVLGVVAYGDYLSLIVPGRRSDFVMRYRWPPR